MLSQSARFLVSSSWRPISTQCRSWLAEASKNPRVTSVARTYFRDLKVDETLAEMDDALELVYFMQRFAYPKETKLESTLKAWFAEKGSNIDLAQVFDICRYLLEDSGRGEGSVKNARDHWARILLSEQWFADQIKNIFQRSKQISIRDCVLVARAFCHCHQGVIPNDFNSSVSNAACAAINVEKNRRLTIEELCNTAEFILPLAESSGLWNAMIPSVEALNPSDIVVFLATLIRTNPSRHDIHAYCLNSAMNPDSPADIASSLQSCHALLACQCSCFDAKAVQQYSVKCVDRLLDGAVCPPFAKVDFSTIDQICEILHQGRFLNLPVASRVSARLVELVSSPGVGALLVCAAFRGLAILQRKKEALSLLNEIAKLPEWQDPSLTPDSISSRYIVQGMAAVQHYEKPLFDPCFRTFQQEPSEFSAADVAFFVFVASHLSEPYPASVFDQFAARITSSVKFQRSEVMISPQQLALLLKGFATAKYAVVSNEKLTQFIAQSVDACSTFFSVSECLSLVAVIHELRFTTLDKVVDVLLTNIAASISSASASVVTDVAIILSRIGMRNVALLTAAGDRLRVTNGSFENIVTFVVAMRFLKMQQALKKLDLAALVPLTDVLVTDDHILIQFSSREKFPVDVDSGTLGGLKTSSLMMLFCLVKPPTSIFAALQTREPCEKLDSDILVRAILSCSKSSDMTALLELGACTIPEMSSADLALICERIAKAERAPSAFFRLIGKRVFQQSDSMSIDQAISCLTVYAKHNVRDDKVIKALFQRLTRLQRGVLSSKENRSKVLYCTKRLGTQWAAELSSAVSKSS